jgi:ABC-type nitrate/sulfonate/bicarbonate transport system substrate-binding protein
MSPRLSGEHGELRPRPWHARMSGNLLGVAAILLLLAACGPAPSAAPTLAPAATQVQPAAARAPAAPAASPAPAASALAPLAPPVKVRIGVQYTAADGSYFIAAERGYFEQLGLEAEFEYFASASDMIPALATGQLDLGALGYNPATLNAIARGVAIKMVADKGSLSPGHGFAALLVRKELVDSGAVRGIGDLRDRTIANTPPPNATGLAVSLSRALATAGLTEDDLTVQPMPFGDMPAALAGGAVDAVVVVEPLLSSLVGRGVAVQLIGMDQVHPYQELAPIGYGESFYRERPEAARRFMIGYIRGMRDFVNAFDYGIDRPAIIEIMTKHTSIKDPTVWETMVPAGLNPDGYVYVESGIYDQDWYLAKRTLQQRVDIPSIVDNSYVDYALRVLGRYTPPR